MTNDRDWRGSNEKVRKKRLKASAQVSSGNLVNVAEALSPEERQAIAEVCLEDFESDRQSRSEWEVMHANWVSVYNQTDAPANPPWQGSSDESLGLLTEACNSFHARAYKAFFPSRNPITALVVGRQSAEQTARAKRVAKYLQWKLFVQDQNYKEDKSACLLRAAIHGSDFTKTYFDPLANKIVVRPVRAVDLYVPYHAGPVSIEEVPRKTELIPIALNDGRKRAAFGYFLVPPEPMVVGQVSRPAHETAEQDGGISSTGADTMDWGLIIEQHRDLDLDDDGIAEPYKVWVDVTSRELLRIEVRYEVDDLGRPTRGRMPIEEYTHYRFLVNPDGFYGYGLGFLIGKSNIAINKLLRQYIDATTLAIIGSMSGFISDSLDVGGSGPVKLELGSFKRVSASTEDIQRGIKTLDFKPPGDGIPKAIQQIEARAQRIGAATDALAGDIQKVMQPTTIQTMVEQGLTLFTSVQEFMLTSWSKELDKVYRLNSMYFRGEEWFTVPDKGGMEEAFVTETDFIDDMMILPIADPRLGSKQERIQKAQFLYETATKNPLIANNPAILLAVTRRLFVEMEIDNIDEILPKTAEEIPPPPPDPKAQALQMKAQLDQQKMQADIAKGGAELQLEQQRSQAHAANLARETEAQVMTERMKAQAEIEVSRQKAAAEQQLEASRAMFDRYLNEQKQQHEMMLANRKTEADIKAKAQAAKAQAKIAASKAKTSPK